MFTLRLDVVGNGGTQSWLNVGPASHTVNQHSNNIGSMSRVCWVSWLSQSQCICNHRVLTIIAKIHQPDDILTIKNHQ